MRKLFSFILMMALVIWISYAAECDTSIWLKHDQPYSYERHTITVLGSDPNGTKCGIYVNSVLKWIDVGSRQEFSDFSIAVDDAISVFTSEDVVVKEADWTCGVIIGGAVNHTFEKNAGGIFTFNGRNINAVDVGNDFTVCGIEVDGVVRWISQGDAEDFGGLEIRVLFVSGTEAVINPSYDGDECKLRIIPCECESSRECPSCVDTDSGIDSSTQGVVNARQWSGSSLASVTGVDSCVDSRILKEWSCGELHTPSGVLLIENRITCEAGCMEGVCKPRQNITVTNCILTETLDPYIKNELILWYSDGTSQEYSDYCDGTYAVEFSCEGGLKKTQKILCEFGCASGVCLHYQKGNSCQDSDGKNYYNKGEIIFSDPTSESIVLTDECTGKKSVIERLCNGNNKSVETYECDAGCEDGACIYPKKGCTDTDSDVFLKGSVNVTNPDGTVTAFEDRCDGQALIELGCNGFSRIETIVECESGCNDGACVPRADPCIGCDGECIEGICKEDIGSCKTNADCHDDDPCTLNTCSGICRTQKISGCNMDGRCVPYSARQGNAYCGPDGNISTQKSNGKECKRDYECITNVCEENRCSEGMLQKILNWFMKLFSS